MAPAPQSVSNETVAATYDRLARPYDWFLAPLGAGTRRRALDLLSVERDDRVLEVGCGPGRALAALAGRLDPPGRAIGLDAARGMLARAHDRTAEPPTRTRVDLVLGDARSLPLAGNAVDVVFLEDTLELFSREEMGAVLGECERVLDPGGRLGVVTMERENAERDRFVRAYDWAFEHVPGLDRFGCRPIYARRILESEGFAVEHRERHRRGGVWPVEILVGRPA